MFRNFFSIKLKKVNQIICSSSFTWDNLKKISFRTNNLSISWKKTKLISSLFYGVKDNSVNVSSSNIFNN